jgi:hypothetical protein
MATPDFIAQLPIEPTTLPAKEYLEFLRMLEHGLPRDTRGYLVTINGDGTRKLHPVGEGHSVVNLHTSLVDHLNDGFFSGDFYKGLLEHCRARVTELFSQDNERTHIALDASSELEQIGLAGLKCLPDDADTLVMRTFFIRTITLAQAIISSLSDPIHETEDLRQKIHGGLATPAHLEY